jgi:hypothetical protein
MKRIALATIAALLSLPSLPAPAFPLIFQPGIGVQPWVPTPTQRIHIILSDTLSGLYPSAPARVTSASATIQRYNQIAVTATFEAMATHGPDVTTFSVDGGCSRHPLHSVQ